MDLKESIFDIAFNVLYQLGLMNYYLSKVKRFYREKPYETTKYIIEEASSENYLIPRFLNRFFLFEINGSIIKIDSFSKLTGEESGIFEGGEINLKLDESYVKECESEKNISIIFKKSGPNDNQTVLVNLARNELLSNAIKKYRSKSGDKDYTEKFIFNAWSLGFNLKNKMEEIGLSNNSYIIVVSTKGKNGGPGLPDFVDVKDGKVKNLELNPNVPKWRFVRAGLNIFGICNNSECEAFNKEVIYIVNTINVFCKFDLKNEARSIRCSMCNEEFEAKTCGFYKCEYQIYGKTIEDGEEKKFKTDPKETKDDDFEYFDPRNEEWQELIIYVLQRQHIKYKKN